MSPNNYISVYQGDNLQFLQTVHDGVVDLMYIDPPFNTGNRQYRNRFHTQNGKHIVDASYGFDDAFDDYIGFIKPRMLECYRVLAPTGSLFFHIDYREAHYVKILLDKIFGRECFMNEIIWSYDYGARSKKRWSAKHDTIFWYAKNPKKYTYNYDAIDRIPYLAPDLVGPEKAALGKTPTDVWWHTIVSPNGKEKTGYATQKPLGIINRIVRVHSNPDDLLCDVFAGSGTFGESAYRNGRNCILADMNPDAITVMKKRFADFHTTYRTI